MHDLNIKSNPVVWLSTVGAAIILFMVSVVIFDQVTHSGNISKNDKTTSAAPAGQTGSNFKTGNRIGNLAPDFALKTADNRDIKLSDFRGKNVIINFWATWCGPCRYEMGSLQSIHETWEKADVILLAIATQDGFDNARSYAETNGLTFTIPVDIPGKVAEGYGVRGLPTSFFINRDGVITSIKVGPFISVDEILERMVTFK